MKMQELAERAVRADGWRWMRRMLTLNHGTVVSVRGNGVPQTLECGTAQPDNPLPNLSDPATLGCLLALVREKHGPNTCVMVCGLPTHWLVYEYGRRDIVTDSTEAKALVAALEAAP